MTREDSPLTPAASRTCWEAFQQNSDDLILGNTTSTQKSHSLRHNDVGNPVEGLNKGELPKKPSSCKIIMDQEPFQSDLKLLFFNFFKQIIFISMLIEEYQMIFATL